MAHSTQPTSSFSPSRKASLDFLHLGAVAEVDAGVLHPFRECLAEHGVNREEHRSSVDEHHDLAAELIEDTGKLNCSIARPHNDDALGLLPEVKAVRIDSTARTGELVLLGTAGISGLPTSPKACQRGKMRCPRFPFGPLISCFEP